MASAELGYEQAVAAANEARSALRRATHADVVDWDEVARLEQEEDEASYLVQVAYREMMEGLIAYAHSMAASDEDEDEDDTNP